MSTAKLPNLLLPAALALLLPAAGAQSLTTLFAQNNGGSAGGNVYFQVVVTNPAGLVVTKMDVNCRNQTSPTFQLTVYLTHQTHAGKEATRNAWLQVSQGTGTTQAADVPAPCDLDDFLLPPGSYGMAITHTLGHGYTNGSGSNQKYSNKDLTLNLGTATNVPFTGSPFSPRVWNGTIHYRNTSFAGFGLYGLGCTGSNGVPRLAAMKGSLPKLGTTLQIDLTNLPTKVGPVLVFNGFRKDKLGPLALPFDLSPLGFTGCSLQVSFIWFGGTANQGGKATYNLPIPKDPVLVDGIVYMQAAVLDQGANPAGYTFTNGGAGRIGP